MEVVDLNGKTIKVTDLKAAIAQAEMFSGYSDKTSPKELNQLCQAYWIDMRNKLRKLSLVEFFTKLDAEQVEDPIANTLPTWVKEMREKYPVTLDNSINSPNENISFKGFSKDRKDSPLYGAHSCVRTLENLNRLDRLEIGETWERFGSPSITRIF